MSTIQYFYFDINSFYDNGISYHYFSFTRLRCFFNFILYENLYFLFCWYVWGAYVICGWIYWNGITRVAITTIILQHGFSIGDSRPIRTGQDSRTHWEWETSWLYFFRNVTRSAMVLSACNLEMLFFSATMRNSNFTLPKDSPIYKLNTLRHLNVNKPSYS